MWRHHDNIWRTSDVREADLLVFNNENCFYRETGDYEQMCHGAIIQTQSFFLQFSIKKIFKKIPLLCRNAVFCSLTIKDWS